MWGKSPSSGKAEDGNSLREQTDTAWADPKKLRVQGVLGRKNVERAGVIRGGFLEEVSVGRP